MICSCGLDAELKVFDSFQYYYCGECKKEVAAEERQPNFTFKAGGETAYRKGMTVPGDNRPTENWSESQKIWEDTFGVKAQLKVIPHDAKDIKAASLINHTLNLPEVQKEINRLYRQVVENQILYGDSWLQITEVDRDNGYIYLSSLDLPKSLSNINIIGETVAKYPPESFPDTSVSRFMKSMTRKEMAEMYPPKQVVRNYCLCGNTILADTEDWEHPLCNECYKDLGEPRHEPCIDYASLL